MPKKARVFDRAMKLAAVRRLLGGENVSALARELKVRRKDLYRWRDNFRARGPDGLRGRGRPRKADAGEPAPTASGGAGGAPAPRAVELAEARRRIAELERKIGQQQVELDFFRQALRQVGGRRRPSDGPGAGTSTRSSRR